MLITIFLILFPLLCAPAMYYIRDNKKRAYVTYLAAGLIASATIALTVFWALEGAQPIMAFQSTGLIP